MSDVLDQRQVELALSYASDEHAGEDARDDLRRCIEALRALIGYPCQCDPPGSGEEFCNDACVLRAERDRYRGLVHRKNRQAARFYRRMFANAEERDRLRGAAEYALLMIHDAHPAAEGLRRALDAQGGGDE